MTIRTTEKIVTTGAPFSSKREPLISVLVAAYNIDGTFEACMSSILGQTYGNLEVVVVDDGSTDVTPSLCDEAAARDGRVSVVHQVNGGLSAARNAGLERASGEYIIFADSDDMMMPTMIETLCGLLCDTDSDIAYCDWFVNEMGSSASGDAAVAVLTPDEFMPLILTDRITSHAWNKLFRRGLWEGIKFPLGRVAQDMAVMHLAFARASKVTYTSEQLYLYYAGNPDNISNTNKAKPASSIDRAYALESRYEMARESYPAVAEEVFTQLASFKVAAYYKALGRGDGRAGAIGTWLGENAGHVRSSGIGVARKALAAVVGTPLEGIVARAVARRLKVA